jgi:uncharacterized protein
MAPALPVRRALTLVPAGAAAGRTLRLEEFFRRIGYVTLKLTSGCNLHCAYCNVEAVTPKTPRMSIERFRRVARLLIENSSSPHVGLEFHGGEPLLLPDEWFEEAVAYARALARQHRRGIEFPLTTNGTLLTEERLLRLRRLGVRFCLSVDGPPEVNDVLRGGGHAVARAIDLFRKHGVGFGVLTVLSRANVPHLTRVMDWFREVGVADFRVNFLEPQGRGNDESHLLTGEEMFEGMRQVLDHMATTDVSVNEAETLMTVDRFLRGRNPRPGRSCWEFDCQAGHTYVAVDHAGTIHACGTDLRNHALGHLDRDLDVDHYEATLRRLHHKDDWYVRCFDCAAKKICRHSCATSDYNSKTYREHECRFTKLFYQHLCANPHKPRHIAEVVRARRLPPPGAFVPVSEVGRV